MAGAYDYPIPDPIDVTLVLLGPPGSGKSETGNTLLGNKYFKTAIQSSQETTTSKRKKCNTDEINLTIVDTPGMAKIGDFYEILDYLDENISENYVFGITLRVGRCKITETRIIEDLFKKKRALEYTKCRTFFIFTNSYELADYGKELTEDDFQEWLINTQDISQIIKTHGLEYCVVENDVEKIGAEVNREQSRGLIRKIKRTSLKHVKHKETTQNMETTANEEYEKHLKEEIKLSVEDILNLSVEIMNCSRNEQVEKIHQILKRKNLSMSPRDINRALTTVSPGKLSSTQCNVL